jgi:membrane-associated phospholipid phosphatase
MSSSGDLEAAGNPGASTQDSKKKDWSCSLFRRRAKGAIDNEDPSCKGKSSRTYSLQREDNWNLKKIRWGAILRRQDHAGLLLIIFFYIATGIIHWACDPRVNVFYIYDATISYPPANKRGFEATVPAWAAIFIPLLMSIATLIVGEIYYSKSEHHSLTDAIAVILYFILDLAQAVGLALMTTEATKVAVGRYRPDFLARCDPVDPGTVTLEYGNNTIGMYPCTDTYSESTIQDGRQSYPSGHTSFSFTLGAYGAGYMIWCWNMRFDWSPRSRGPWREFLSDLGNVVAKIWTCCLLGFPWGVGCTRIIDYQHNVSDVVAGMVLGLGIATIFLLRAVPRYRRVLTYVPDPCPEDNQDDQDVLAAGSSMTAHAEKHPDEE